MVWGVCMYICRYVMMYVRVYVCMYVCMYVFMYEVPTHVVVLQALKHVVAHVWNR